MSPELTSVVSKRNLGTTFSAGVLAYFPQYQQNFITLYCFPHFLPLLFSCTRCSLEQSTRKVIIYLKNYQTTTIFFFSSSFLGTFFWVPITFKRYHFQSGYDPAFTPLKPPKIKILKNVKICWRYHDFTHVYYGS